VADGPHGGDGRGVGDSGGVRRRCRETRQRGRRGRADYEHQLDAKFAGARGFVDAILTPDETRDTLAFLLEVSAEFTGPHLGAFALPGLS